MNKFKRAFSTVAFSDFGVEAMVDVCLKSGIKAIEIRLDCKNRIFGLDSVDTENAITLLKSSGITITNLGTSVCYKGYNRELICQIEPCSILAQKTGASGIRVFLGDFSRKRSYFTASDYDGIVSALKESADIAGKYGVEIWIETHNEFSTGESLKKLLDDVRKDNVKIVWDVIHPIEKGEIPTDTISYIGNKIAHVHIKDGIKSKDMNETDYCYTCLGCGDVPIDAILNELDNIGYNGYLSLEWECLWRNELKGIYEDPCKLLSDYNAYLDRVQNNIIPLISDESWQEWMPSAKKIAQMFKNDFDSSLDIFLSSNSYGIGKWICDFSVEPGKTYKLTGSCHTECTENDAYFIYTLFDQNGNMLIRDHAQDCKRIGGSLFFDEMIDTPSSTVSMRVEMWLKGYYAEAKWHQPRLEETKPLPERNVRVSIAYIHPDYKRVHTIENNKEEILKSIDKSAEFNPDLIVISEAMNSRSTNVPLKLHAEEIETGEICMHVRRKAKKYNSYIVYNFHEVENGEYYNTSALFGRNGEICGKYRKTHLTVTEFDQGMTPGDSYPVFETDFGKIGMLICFDHYFSSTTEEIVKNGAEIIAVSSAGDAHAKSLARAMDGGVWFAIAGLNTENDYGWGPGRIISPDGTVVAHTSKTFEPANYVINLNKKIRREWLSLGPAMSHIKSVYRYEKNNHIDK